MINELRIQNFKCLRDTSLAFEPLTVLIGPNDSGKTSILEALQLLGRTTSSQIPSIFNGSRSFDNIVWRRDKTLQVSWDIQGRAQLQTGESPEFSHHLTISSQGLISNDDFQFKGMSARNSGSHINVPGTDVQSGTGAKQTSLGYALLTHLAREFTPAAEAFASSGIYRLDPRALRSTSVPKQGAVLSSQGDNLAAVLDGLLSGPNRGAANDMEEALRDAMPTLTGFSTPPAADGNTGEKTIEFVLAGNDRRPVTIPCDLVSDGAMLLTAFLALAYSDTPEVLLIEEPENGLHPGRLKDVIDLLRRMTTGEIGNKPRQILSLIHI